MGSSMNDTRCTNNQGSTSGYFQADDTCSQTTHGSDARNSSRLAVKTLIKG